MAMDTDTRRAFLRALDEDEDFRQEVRQRLLSKELLELPEKFAAFSAKVNDFMVYVNDFIAEQKQFNAEVRKDINGLQGSVAGLNEDVSVLKDDVAGLKIGQSRIESRLNRIADDIGMLKGNVAFYAARDRFEFILEQLGLEYVHMLSQPELVDMVRSYGSTRIEFSHRRSFYNADLVLEAKDTDGATCYVTVEASYTADKRDTDRVIRNIEFLNRFTGNPAHGIIASVDNDRDIEPLFEAGTLHWFQLLPEDVQPQ